MPANKPVHRLAAETLPDLHKALAFLRCPLCDRKDAIALIEKVGLAVREAKEREKRND